MRTTALLTLALTVACSRDLTLPHEPLTPTIVSFEPMAAYSGDTLAITGSGFDADASANTVEFAGGVTAAAFAVAPDGSTLSVYVPEGAFEGPLLVYNQQGNSAPSKDSFYYRGLGHPVRGTQVTDLKVLHDPPAIAIAGGTVYLPSKTFRALYTAVGRPMELGPKLSAFTRSADGSALYSGFGLGAADALTQIDPATRRVVARSGPGTVVPLHLAAPASPVADGPIVYAEGEDVDQWEHFVAWTRSGETFVEHKTPRREDLNDIFAIAALPGAQGAIAVVDLLEAGVLVRTVVHANPITGQMETWDPPAGVRPSGPIAVTRVEGRDFGVVALDDGGLAFLTVDGTNAWRRHAPLATSALAALVAIEEEGAPFVLGVNGRDSTVIAFDATKREVAWTVTVTDEPGLIDADPTTGLVAVAGPRTNRVDVLDGGTGAYSARVNFAVDLGNDEACQCGGSTPYEYLPSENDTLPHHAQFLARAPRKLVVMDADTLRFVDTVDLDYDASAPLGLVGEPNGRTWVLHRSDVGLVDRDAPEKIVARNLPLQPIQALPLAGNRLLLGSSRQVDLYRYEAGTLLKERTLELPPTALLASMVRQVNGDVVLLWRFTGDGAWVAGGQWTLADLAAGRSAKREYTSPDAQGPFLTAMTMEFGPMLLFAGNTGAAATKPTAQQFDREFVRTQEIASVASSEGVFWPSPDGRFFGWTRPDATMRVIYYWPPDPKEAYRMSEYETYRLPALPARSLFDPSGEWIYVPLPSLDQISVYQ